MPRQRFCDVCKDWHDLAEPWPQSCRRETPVHRSELSAPMIVSDSLDYVEHPIDGRRYTSKALFRATTRAAGYVEVGDDPSRLKPKQRTRPDTKAIVESIRKAEARFARGERVAPH